MEVDQVVKRRIKDLGGEIPRFFVQLKMLDRYRSLETAARRKGESREGNNPDQS